MHVLTASVGFGLSDCERSVEGAVLAQPVLAATSLAYAAAGIVALWWATRNTAPLAGVAGVALVAVGAGSFAFHGPQPSWAGLAHDLPIVALGAVCVAGVARSGCRRQWSAWVIPAWVFALGLAAYAMGRSGSPLCRPDSLWQFHGAWHILSSVAAVWATRAMLPGPAMSVGRRAAYDRPVSEPALTDDGRYIVVNGRRWRATDPSIPEERREELTRILMAWRREVRRTKGTAEEAAARAGVHATKVALGERGTPPWWEQTDAQRRSRWQAHVDRPG
jgi:hypothetical protein